MLQSKRVIHLRLHSLLLLWWWFCGWCLVCWSGCSCSATTATLPFSSTTTTTATTTTATTTTSEKAEVISTSTAAITTTTTTTATTVMDAAGIAMTFSSSESDCPSVNEASRAWSTSSSSSSSSTLSSEASSPESSSSPQQQQQEQPQAPAASLFWIGAWKFEETWFRQQHPWLPRFLVRRLLQSILVLQESMYHQIDDQGQALKPPRSLQLVHATPHQAHLVRTELPTAATPTAAEHDQAKSSKTWSFSWSSAASDPAQHTQNHHNQHQHHHHHRVAFQMERRDDGHMYYVEEGLGVYRVIPVELPPPSQPPPQPAYS